MDKEIITGTISLAIDIYSYIIIARILMSWFPNSRDSSAGRFLFSVTEPVLAPARRIIPPIAMIDFSAIAVIFALSLIQNIIISF